MTLTVRSVEAEEILDSRGQPTVQVRLEVSGQGQVEAGVPAGASTGAGEAVELRDGDSDRYAGRGVHRACAAVRTEIAELICGRSWSSLAELDAAVVDLDGTPDLSRLGANAVVGVSMAAARGFARNADQPLHRWLAGQPALEGARPRLPVPHFNVINGGAHAANTLEFQEFMIAPLGAPTFAEALRAGAAVYAALRRRLRADGQATGLGDEGGFAPDLATPERACELLEQAITDAGYHPGTDGVSIALDPAANGFYAGGQYTVGGERLTREQLVDRYADMLDTFAIHSLEDGMAEDDDDGWRLLTERLGNKIQLVGDDNFVTDPERIATAQRTGVANAALIKVNQIGTVSQALAALRVCRDGGFGAMVSHRSGETNDSFIADLTVAAGCGQLKSGAPARGERVAKYNRLLHIESSDPALPYGLPVPDPAA